jgi:hypothetical protein
MAMVIKTVPHSPEAIAAAAWWVWIVNEQPLTAVPSTFGVSGDHHRRPLVLTQSLGSPLVMQTRAGSPTGRG